MVNTKKGKVKPAGTLDYEVKNGDTIEKIALKWNSTPNNIMHLNCLASRMIFPGQVLYVPDPDYVPPPPPPVTTLSPTHSNTNLNSPLAIIDEDPNRQHHSSSDSLFGSQSNVSTSNEKSNTPSSGFNFFRWRSSKPGHVESVQQNDNTPTKSGGADSSQSRLTSRHTLSEEEAKQLDEECMQRFLKINCKIVTRSKGCYDGVLIITPSAVMFDPVDQAASSLAQSSAQLSETTTTNVADAQQQPQVADKVDSTLNVNLLRTKSTSSSSTIYDEASAIIPIELISNVIMYEDLALKDVQEYFDFQHHTEMLSFDEKIENNDGTEEKKEIVFNLDSNNADAPENATSNAVEEKIEKEKVNTKASSSKAFKLLASETPPPSLDRQDSKITNLNENDLKLSLLNDALSELEIASNSNDESNNRKRNSQDDKLSTTSSSTNNNNKTDLSTKSESLSTSIIVDKDNISCYLCIKVNTTRDFLTCPLDRRMKNRLRSEFWFQIYDNKSYKTTDKICAFFLEWKNDSFSNGGSASHSRNHFQLVKQDEKLTDLIAGNLLSSSRGLNKSFSSTNRLLNRGNTFVKDWEIVNLQEFEMKLKQEIEIEREYKTLPKLNEPSTILKDDHLRKLNVNLIPRAVGYNWALAFSTEKNGFCLNTIYRNLADVESPCLIVVMDTNLNIFGAMTPSKLAPSDHYYGTGESFLFSFYPSFKVYKWTGENNFFIKGNSEGIIFGSGEGTHGLWFDSDLFNGQTQNCKTYDNEMLTCSEYFKIKSIEIWTFADDN